MAGITCCKCGLHFMVPSVLEAEWRRSHRGFHCPNGHELAFKAESDLEKLWAENDRLRKEKEWAEQAKRLAEQDAKTKERSLARLQKRAKNGVCPCCHRTFQQLARHMASKHPEFADRTE